MFTLGAVDAAKPRGLLSPYTIDFITARFYPLKIPYHILFVFPAIMLFPTVLVILYEYESQEDGFGRPVLPRAASYSKSNDMNSSSCLTLRGSQLGCFVPPSHCQAAFHCHP